MKIIFVSADGKQHKEAQFLPGDRLLDIAHSAQQPLEGTCEGAMACSTCHVILTAEGFASLERASDDEEDMLDFASGVTRTSRLACQIKLRSQDDSLLVRMPTDVKNLLKRS